jgi:prophage regulatory protein
MARHQPRPASPVRTDLAALQFLRVAEVCALLRISRPTLWRLRRDREFPLPTSLSRRSIGWRLTDVESWLDARAHADGRRERPTASRPVAPPPPAGNARVPRLESPAKRGRRQLPLTLA